MQLLNKNNQSLGIAATISGIIFYLSIIGSMYYYDHLAGREDCNTGIAPCWLGIEFLVMMLAGFVLSHIPIILGLKGQHWLLKLAVLFVGVPLTGLAMLYLGGTSTPPQIVIVTYPVVYCSVYALIQFLAKPKTKKR